jgi:hypothetical protein
MATSGAVNLTRRQSLEVERSLAALAAARAHFLPEVTLSARYTRADGGRQFTVPVSQLLNPAYQTLNELLVAGGGTPRFTPLADQSFPLQQPREQDTRVTLRQPLYAPAIPASAAAARAARARRTTAGRRWRAHCGATSRSPT